MLNIECNIIDYLDFIEVWQASEFWGVLDGRKLWNDKAEFIDQIYQITVQFLVEEDVS